MVETQKQTFILLKKGLEQFNAMCKAASSIGEFATFKLDDEGLHYRSMSSDRTSLLEMHIPAKFFDTLSIKEPIKFTLPLRTLLSIVKNEDKDSDLFLAIDPDRIELLFNKRARKTLSISLLNEDLWFEQSLSIKFNVNLVIQSDVLREILSDIANQTDEVKIVSSLDWAKFVGSSEGSNVSITISRENSFVHKLEALVDSSSTYSVRAMLNFVNSVRPQVFNLQYSTNSPMLLSCSLQRGYPQVYFYLAPVIQR